MQIRVLVSRSGPDAVRKFPSERDLSLKLMVTFRRSDSCHWQSKSQRALLVSSQTSSLQNACTGKYRFMTCNLFSPFLQEYALQIGTKIILNLFIWPLQKL